MKINTKVISEPIFVAYFFDQKITKKSNSYNLYEEE